MLLSSSSSPSSSISFKILVRLSLLLGVFVAQPVLGGHYLMIETDDPYSCMDWNPANTDVYLSDNCPGFVDNQKWIYDSQMRIRSKHNQNKCLDYNYDGQYVWMHDCHNQKNQAWFIDNADVNAKHYGRIRSKYDTTQCLTVNLTNKRFYLKDCDLDDDDYDNEFFKMTKTYATYHVALNPEFMTPSYTNPGKISYQVSGSNTKYCLNKHSMSVKFDTDCSSSSDVLYYREDVQLLELNKGSNECLAHGSDGKTVRLTVCDAYNTKQKWYRYDNTIRSVTMTRYDLCLDVTSTKGVQLTNCIDNDAAQAFTFSSDDFMRKRPNPGCIRIHEDEKLGGASRQLCAFNGQEMMYNTLGSDDVWNDDITSVEMDTGVAVYLYEHGDGHGKAAYFEKDVMQLQKNELYHWEQGNEFRSWTWNDRVSSLKVMPVLKDMTCELEFLDGDYTDKNSWAQDVIKRCVIKEGSDSCTIDYTFEYDMRDDLKDIKSHICNCKVIINNGSGRSDERFHIDPYEFIQKDDADDKALANNWSWGGNAKSAKAECRRPRNHDKWT